MNGPNDRKDPKVEAGKLIGGYATGNLTNAEKRILHEAALQDQELFDALMDEQALKDLLEAPGIKKELIAALQPKVTLWGRITNWMKTPIALGAVGALATAAVLLVVVATRPPRHEDRIVAVKMDSAVSEPATMANPRNEPKQEVAARQPLDMARKVVAPPVSAGQVAPATPPAPQMELAADAKRDEPVPAAVVAERDQRAAGPTASQAANSQAVQQTPYAQQMNQVAPAASAPPAIFAAVPTVLSVEYSLLRRNAEGRFEPVTGGSVRGDDALRLQVTPNSNGILSLSRSNENGIQTPIAGSIAVNRGQAVTLPAQGSFTASTVGEKLVLTLTDHPSMTDVFSKSAGASALRQRSQSVKAKKDVDRSVASEAGRLDTVVGKKVVLPAAAARTSADSADSHQLVIEISIPPLGRTFLGCPRSAGLRKLCECNPA